MSYSASAPGKTTIYALRDPDTRELRYIGKTKNLRARMSQHSFEKKNLKVQTYKVRWLRTLDALPVVEVLEVVDDKNWAERERYWIAKYRNEGARLTNIADGGQMGCPSHSEETKAKLRKLAITRGATPPSQLGRKASEATREKLRVARKDTVPPPMGGWNKGQCQTHCGRGHDRAIYGYYRNGRYRNCKACMKLRTKRPSTTADGQLPLI